jgi:hypothetical protein
VSVTETVLMKLIVEAELPPVPDYKPTLETPPEAVIEMDQNTGKDWSYTLPDLGNLDSC